MKKFVALFLVIFASISSLLAQTHSGGGGGGGGTTKSVTISGTTNQITVTGVGSCSSTTTVNCQLSLPSALTFPGTITLGPGASTVPTGASLGTTGLSYPAVTVAQHSTTGTALYDYAIVGADSAGNTQAVYGWYNAGATLTGAAYLSVTVAAWPSVVGSCTVYRVLGAPSLGSIGTISSCASGGTLNDIGQSATAVNPPNNTSGAFSALSYNLGGAPALTLPNGDVTSLGVGTNAALWQNLTNAEGGGGTTALYNVAVGAGALEQNNTAAFNTGVGYQVLYSTAGGATCSGCYNTALGYQAGYSGTTHFYNVVLGAQAMYLNLQGDYNVAAGYRALYNNLNSYNTGIGYEALYNNTTAASNTGIGDQALYTVTNGDHNTGVGDSALKLLATGGYNAALGYNALSTIVSGQFNAAMGAYALASATTNSGDNVAVGYGAGYAGTAVTTGYDSVFIGYNAAASAATNHNEIVIGSGATGDGTNTGVIGNSSMTDIYFGSSSAAAIVHSANRIIHEIPFNFSSSAVLSAQTAFSVITYSGTITGITWLSDVSGGVTVDILTKAWATNAAPCTSATDIANGGDTMSAAFGYTDTTLTSWTKTLTGSNTAPLIVCVALTSPTTIHTLTGKITVSAIQ